MKVRATRFLCRLPGGSQSHLLEANDGNAYIVKLKDNPQGTRTLVNEWIAAKIFAHLGIPHPKTVLVSLDQEFLRQNPAVSISTPHARTAPAAGLHFGSRHAGHRSGVAVYDFLPDSLLARVENLNAFLGALAVDLWTGNIDRRQCVFLRNVARGECGEGEGHGSRKGFIALMIDNGQIFAGSQWLIRDYSRPNSYFHRLVYNAAPKDCEPWIQSIESFPFDLMRDIKASVPKEWIRNDGDRLSDLLRQLYKRRTRVRACLMAALEVPSHAL